MHFHCANPPARHNPLRRPRAVSNTIWSAIDEASYLPSFHINKHANVGTHAAKLGDNWRSKFCRYLAHARWSTDQKLYRLLYPLANFIRCICAKNYESWLSV